MPTIDIIPIVYIWAVVLLAAVTDISIKNGLIISGMIGRVARGKE